MHQQRNQLSNRINDFNYSTMDTLSSFLEKSLILGKVEGKLDKFSYNGNGKLKGQIRLRLSLRNSIYCMWSLKSFNDLMTLYQGAQYDFLTGSVQFQSFSTDWWLKCQFVVDSFHLSPCWAFLHSCLICSIFQLLFCLCNSGFLFLHGNISN